MVRRSRPVGSVGGRMRVDRFKTCKTCGEDLPISEFYADRRNTDGLFATCKQCTCRRARERKDANPELRRREVESTRRYRQTAAGKAARKREYIKSRERTIARAAKWNRAHPEVRRAAVQRRRDRLGKKGRARVSREATAARRAMWGNRCWVCGAHATQMDHVKPVAAGGPDLPANLRPICGSCNRRKGARWPFPISTKEARRVEAA